MLRTVISLSSCKEVGAYRFKFGARFESHHGHRLSWVML
jgi:hypothetical protein